MAPAPPAGGPAPTGDLLPAAAPHPPGDLLPAVDRPGALEAGPAAVRGDGPVDPVDVRRGEAGHAAAVAVGDGTDRAAGCARSRLRA